MSDPIKIRCEGKRSVACKGQQEISQEDIAKNKSKNAGKFICSECVKIKDKKYFDVKVQCNIPALITFRVFAENEEQALEMINRQTPTNIRYEVLKRVNIKATVYEAGMAIIKLIKNFR